ncbi:hypothetical protein [Mucilaginibacter sp. CSA2-8R]|uniref:hypothetical protein n=1 Tax=Mucilaginibacter sp. CSA2-8R TaxID=3141542 RepID=UPI00315C7935
MARSIYFTLDENQSNDTDVRFQFGAYALTLFYAKQIDESKAEELFNTTLTEYCYRLYHNLSTEGYDSDDESVHFDASEIMRVIAFIDEQVVPALDAETIPLIEKYGGVKLFQTNFDNEEGFLGHLSIFEDEVYNDDPESLIYNLERFKALLQQSVDTGQEMIGFFEF